MEATLARVKALIIDREKIDTELAQLLRIDTAAPVAAEKRERKPLTCSKCGSNEHTARTCTVPATETETPLESLITKTE